MLELGDRVQWRNAVTDGDKTKMEIHQKKHKSSFADISALLLVFFKVVQAIAPFGLDGLWRFTHPINKVRL